MKNAYLVPLIERARTFPPLVRNSFGSMTEVQLNWRPAPETWSIGLVLEHVIHSNQLYMPQLIALRDGSHRPNLWERTRLMSRLFEKQLLKVTDPATKTKTKAPKIFQPNLSAVLPDIVDRFNTHHHSLVDMIVKLDHLDHESVVIHSPLSKLITLRLSVASEIFVNHTQRHLNQATELTQHPKFPPQ